MTKTPIRKIRLTLALVLGAMFTFVLAALIFVEIPAGNRDVLYVVVGSLGSAFVMMITFYFGDSEGKETTDPTEVV